MAKEMQHSQNNILNQAAHAMLVQANATTKHVIAY